jgi:hypothetical protein
MREKIEMFSQYPLFESSRLPSVFAYEISDMLSFLKNGDIHNTIKTITKLPGLFTADGDKIKYALLNHSTAMRKNLMDGTPIFANIRQWEAEIETRDIASIASGRLPSMAENAGAAAAKCISPFADNDICVDNAAFAVIMTKEIAFLDRTVQMISLVAARYQEEEDDLVWGHEDHHTNHANHTNHAPNQNDAEEAMSRRLSTTFLISSSNLRKRFNNLCALAGTTSILVNGMTTMDRPHNEKQLLAERYVISDIFLHFCKFDAEHRDPVVAAFLELRDISVAVWRMLTTLAFSNLFRLTEGSEFATFYQPNDAIFTQGRYYRLANNPFYEKTSEAAAAVMMLRVPTDPAIMPAMSAVNDDQEV